MSCIQRFELRWIYVIVCCLFQVCGLHHLWDVRPATAVHRQHERATRQEHIGAATSPVPRHVFCRSEPRLGEVGGLFRSCRYILLPSMTFTYIAGCVWTASEQVMANYQPDTFKKGNEEEEQVWIIHLSAFDQILVAPLSNQQWNPKWNKVE